MIVAEINQQSLENEKEGDSSLNLNLDIIKKSEENYCEETKSLKYDSSYKAVLSDIKSNNILRKSSTISTNVSQNENGLENISLKNSYNDENTSSTLPNFNRERLYSTPISNYYDGTDNYFRELFPNKNDYQKSNNYLPKEIYFKKHFNSEDINLIYEEKETKNGNPNNQILIPQTTSNPNSFRNFPIYYLGYCGPIIPFTPKSYKKNETNKNEDSNAIKEKKNEFKDIKNKQPIPTPIFISPINPIKSTFFLNQVPTNKNHYNKFQTKKMKTFSERSGDWTCNSCHNLNFAFRNICNRCKLPKPGTQDKNGNNDEKKNSDGNNKNYYQNKRYKKSYQYYNESVTNYNKNIMEEK
jgi:hypothetical protein